jgi:uncharacterized membrane protein
VTTTIERSVARLLTLGTYSGVVALAIGVLLMIREGISPLDGPDAGLDLGTLPADLIALRPAGWLWLGILVILATPAARVTVALAGFLSTGERALALVSTAILAVIGIGIVVGLNGG